MKAERLLCDLLKSSTRREDTNGRKGQGRVCGQKGEKDEKEKSLRRILNFGHTFAHAYEASLGYSKKLNHGEAVILGMQSALSFSLKNNLIQKNDYYSILKHISKVSLPLNIKKIFKIRDLNKILSRANQILNQTSS